jgi:hypothetical protein
VQHDSCSLKLAGGSGGESQHAARQAHALHNTRHDCIADVAAHIRADHPELPAALLALVAGLASSLGAGSSNSCVFCPSCSGLGDVTPLSSCRSVLEAAAVVQALLDHGTSTHAASLLSVYHMACLMAATAAVGSPVANAGGEVGSSSSGSASTSRRRIRCPFGCCGGSGESGEDALDALLRRRDLGQSSLGSRPQSLTDMAAACSWGSAPGVVPSSSHHHRHGSSGSSVGDAAALVAGKQAVDAGFADRTALLLHICRRHGREVQRAVRAAQAFLVPPAQQGRVTAA